jgi:predicted O-methyltransferase YrrM
MSITRITGFLNHFLTACDEHSLHAPFVYQLYTEIIRKDYNIPQFDHIESIRKEFIKSNKKVILKDFGARALEQDGKIRKISDIAKVSLSPPKTSRLLNRLIKWNKSNQVVELGTSLGINTMYMASEFTGRIFTFEGSGELAKIARNHFQKNGYNNIEVVEGNLDGSLKLKYLTENKVDLVFFDANHRMEPTLKYFEQFKNFAHSGTIFVFDDIYWSAEMKNAWNIICQDKTVSLSLDLFSLGIIFFKDLTVKQHYRLFF